MSLPFVTALQNTCILQTPDPLLDEAFRFAKDNIARCIRYYSLGWGMSNAPHQYTRVVGRDTGWMVLGTDYLAPWFASEALRAFRDRQKSNGQIIEYIDLESGEETDYGLNIGDNTPFYIWAIWHHWQQYSEAQFHADFLPSIQAAADYLLNEIGPDDLLISIPAGTGVHGLTSWRNIIAGAQTPGEVTEINALSAMGLRFAAQYTNDHRYAQGAARIISAINKHLWHEQNYVLYRHRGQPNAQITGDTIFPVLCGITPPDRERQVLNRLEQPDFWTDRGLRTVPNSDPAYDPSTAFGLLGGSWPNLTLWYAAAVARHNPDRALDALRRVARPVVERDGAAMNTRYTEFAEYFHGDTGQNLGMNLSPWTAPTFIWAVLEGLLGLRWDQGQPTFQPHWPAEWEGVHLLNMPYAGGKMDVRLARNHPAEISVNAQ
jgi:glycogen debranching enzyme